MKQGASRGVAETLPHATSCAGAIEKQVFSLSDAADQHRIGFGRFCQSKFGKVARHWSANDPMVAHGGVTSVTTVQQDTDG